MESGTWSWEQQQPRRRRRRWRASHRRQSAAGVLRKTTVIIVSSWGSPDDGSPRSASRNLLRGERSSGRGGGGVAAPEVSPCAPGSRPSSALQAWLRSKWPSGSGPSTKGSFRFVSLYTTIAYSLPTLRAFLFFFFCTNDDARSSMCVCVRRSLSLSWTMHFFRNTWWRYTAVVDTVYIHTLRRHLFCLRSYRAEV